MKRRSFLAGMLTTAAGLLIPYEPKTIYSFPSKRIIHSIYYNPETRETIVLGNDGERRFSQPFAPEDMFLYDEPVMQSADSLNQFLGASV